MINFLLLIKEYKNNKKQISFRLYIIIINKIICIPIFLNNNNKLINIEIEIIKRELKKYIKIHDK